MVFIKIKHTKINMKVIKRKKEIRALCIMKSGKGERNNNKRDS